MKQEAPDPEPLRCLVDRLEYRQRDGWRVWLEDRDRGQGSKGLTLVVQRCGPDTYDPETILRVNHFFIVPAAAYDERSWRRWLFDRLGDVDTHERMEFFKLRDDSAPEPGDGCECGHPASAHDGRHSLCTGCPGTEHRFQAKNPRYCRPYAPSHGFGQDPYLVREIGTEEDRRMSFRNELNPA
jgi:hypothetical protein